MTFVILGDSRSRSRSQRLFRQLRSLMNWDTHRQVESGPFKVILDVGDKTVANLWKSLYNLPSASVGRLKLFLPWSYQTFWSQMGILHDRINSTDVYREVQPVGMCHVIMTSCQLHIRPSHWSFGLHTGLWLAETDLLWWAGHGLAPNRWRVK